MNRPWMPLYVADYRADTMRLSTLEHGAYLLLIMEYWHVGTLPDDDVQLARITGLALAQWRRIRPTIAAFFHDGWKHKRIDAELSRAADISSKRAASAKQRHSKSSAIAPANAEQLDTHARASSQSQSQRNEDIAADAASTGKEYAFESGVIRLTRKDLDRWKANFSHLDVPAELEGLAGWAQSQRSWFNAVAGALTKRNREMQTKLERDRTPDLLSADEKFYGKDGIPGVI